MELLGRRQTYNHTTSIFNNTGKNALSQVIVADDSVKSWLTGLSSTDVPDYIKNAIVIES